MVIAALHGNQIDHNRGGSDIDEPHRSDRQSVLSPRQIANRSAQDRDRHRALLRQIMRRAPITTRPVRRRFKSHGRAANAASCATRMPAPPTLCFEVCRPSNTLTRRAKLGNNTHETYHAATPGFTSLDRLYLFGSRLGGGMRVRRAPPTISIT